MRQPIHHRHPEDAPTKDAENRNQVDNPLCGAKFRSLRSEPDFRVLWNVSIFQRIAYQESFSGASLRDGTGKFVTSFQSIFSLLLGVFRSCA